MKTLLKQYYKLDEETKEMLPFLYMYQELLDLSKNYENVEINNMYDEEILMQTIIKCWYSTNLDANEIINRLLEILNCQDISIKDFEKLDTEDLIELISNEETTKKESKIIGEFFYKGYYCIFCKSEGRYLLILNSNEEADVLIFNTVADIFPMIINRHILNKNINGNNINDYKNLSKD